MRERIMKTIQSLILGSLVFGLSLLAVHDALAVTLVRDGQAVAKIYTLPAADASTPATAKRRVAAEEAPLSRVVRELQYHLQKMSGATV